jgi:hypothetical protein
MCFLSYIQVAVLPIRPVARHQLPEFLILHVLLGGPHAQRSVRSRKGGVALLDDSHGCNLVTDVLCPDTAVPLDRLILGSRPNVWLYQAPSLVRLPNKPPYPTVLAARFVLNPNQR